METQPLFLKWGEVFSVATMTDDPILFKRIWINVAGRGIYLMQELIGKQLGSYQLLYLLGQSDFAEVYLGQHIHSNAHVAMKMWRTHLRGEDWGALRRDAQMIAELDHPNIVPIRDFEVLGDVPLFVMDYIPDGSLRKRYPQDTRVPLSDVASMVTQIASTLQYVHERGCVHLNIKPENLLLGARNRILLSDFAMMTLARGLQTSISSGTAPYMAPEQISGRPLPASDQYALGIVVYEWLCGVKPFDGAYAEVFAGHLMTPPPPLHTKLPELPVEIEQVVMTALAKDPRKRFDSIKSFAAAFSQACNSYVIRAAAPPVQVKTKHTSPLPPVQSGKTSFRVPTFARDVAHRTAGAEQRSQTTSTLAPIRLVRTSPTSTIPPHVVHTPPISRPVPPIMRTSPAPPAFPQPSVRIVYREHAADVNAVVWSPVGTMLASASRDQTVRIWSLERGITGCVYRGHTTPVQALAWSPREARIASAGSVGGVYIWDTLTGARTSAYHRQKGSIADVAWSPSGKRVASCGEIAGVHIWNAANGKLLTMVDEAATQRVVWSPDEAYLACAGLDIVQIWNTQLKRWQSTHIHRSAKADTKVTTLDWSPDSTLVASADTLGRIYIWNVSTVAVITTCSLHVAPIRSLDWSSDGRFIASVSQDGRLYIWQPATGRMLHAYRHSFALTSVRWSPDSKCLAFGSEDGTVTVWQIFS
jgi:serine/threonine protein kinase